MATDLGQLTRAIESHAPDSKEVAERLARAALEVGLSPARIIDEALVPGMADVGARFRDNEIFVPEVLVSARAMNAALAVLEPHLAAWGYQPVGRILIGTVHGDIHDIGKNLAAMMLQGAGFEVRDLGVNVSLAKFNRAIEEFRPHIVGMSALLTTTMPQMERNLRKWEELDLRTGFKVIVGGAPLTAAWATEIGADAYAEDAATGARRALELVSEPRQAD